MGGDLGCRVARRIFAGLVPLGLHATQQVMDLGEVFALCDLRFGERATHDVVPKLEAGFTIDDRGDEHTCARQHVERVVEIRFEIVCGSPHARSP